MNIQIKLSIILIFVQLLSVFESAASPIEKRVFNYINNKNWSEAEKYAKQSDNKVLLKIVLSQKFLDTKYKQNNFSEITNFLQNNPYWPQNEKLRKTAEFYINPISNKKAVYNYYQNTSPKTGNGYKYHALAAAVYCKDPKKLAAIIRKGWIYGNLTKEEVKVYYKNFAKYIREEDHLNRIDELLWQDNILEAENSLHWVSSPYQKSIRVQIAAILKKQNTDELFAKIPKQYYTNGLLFRYLQYKKATPPSAEIISLFAKAGSNPKHADEWWRLRSYYTKEFISQKNFAYAYRLVSTHPNEDKANIRGKEFTAGWLALRFLNKPDLALKHFTRFRQLVKTPISIARGDYWLARTYAAKGEQEPAKKFYKSAANYGYTYYGQLAGIALGQSRISLPDRKNNKPLKNFTHPDLIEATKLIAEYGGMNLAQLYAKVAIRQTKNKDEIVFISSLISKYSKTSWTVDLSRTATQHHVFIKDHAFPTPYQKAHFAVEKPLGYAVIRQESSFNQYIVDKDSRGVGFGLMQMTEDATRFIAKSVGEQCEVHKLTKDPDYNIKVGTGYLNNLLKRLDGSYVMAITAYNAGMSRTLKWAEKYGDPRKMRNIEDVVDWIELLPFDITRNYVQRVLENLAVYETILHKNSKFRPKRYMVQNKNNHEQHKAKMTQAFPKFRVADAK